MKEKDSTNIGLGTQLTHHSLGVIVRVAPRKTNEVHVPFTKWQLNFSGYVMCALHQIRHNDYITDTNSAI